ncbi:MAG: N-acetyltransferase [Alphaproteobacteria bacterium]|nr:N-acetyltransferase [Alphaproteobacteria bacterium]
MPDGDGGLTLRTLDTIAALAPSEWDRCAGGANPFVSHAFLHALEASGSAVAETGWRPLHLLAAGADGRVLGVVPTYLKSHSYGEYVFDWGWAEAFARAGGAYYPKLQVAAPFSPVPGPRLLVPPGPQAPALRQQLIAGLVNCARECAASSVHATFIDEDDRAAFSAAGWILRQGVQFHWNNRGYRDFADFLDTLTSRKRKAIKKERQAVADAGVTLRVLGGDDLTPAIWDRFHRFYASTYDRKWGRPYLTRRFFDFLGDSMGESVVLIWAERAGDPIAAALNIKGADSLFGRNWGASEDVPFLHFEACYYQAIDYAIAHKLARVEAGTQGPHKIARGYLPALTWSAHWIEHAGLRDAVATYCRREASALQLEIEELTAESPYRATE